MGEPDKQEIADAYNTLGGRIYDLRYAEEQEGKYTALFGRRAPEADEISLDVGCGTGLLAKRLKSQSVGLDISPGLLSTARARLANRESSYLVLGDAGELPFRESSFDIVYSVTVLQNTLDPLSSIKEMKRVGKAIAGITALKKAFSRESFEALLVDADLESFEVLDSSGLNDWVALVDF